MEFGAKANVETKGKGSELKGGREGGRERERQTERNQREGRERARARARETRARGRERERERERGIESEEERREWYHDLPCVSFRANGNGSPKP